MFFGWLKRRRRRKLLAQPFPEDWIEVLQRNVHHYSLLSEAERSKLRDTLRVLVAEKNWEGCGGLAMTGEIQVTVAALAALLVLGLPDEHFDMVQSVLVYPDAYVAPGRTMIQGGVVLEGPSFREGEAWYRGPVILSWPDVLAAGRGEAGGHNLVLHEFAHQLDMQNGREVDGTPLLESAEQFQRWQQVMHAEFQQLQRDCRRGRATLLNCYGTKDLGEFFSVSTECFFERPHALRLRHPDLFALLRDYYRQDPSARRRT